MAGTVIDYNNPGSTDNIITKEFNKTTEDCWETGIFNSDCECSMCDHKYECSGSNIDENDD